jgi:hypothetical protein
MTSDLRRASAKGVIRRILHSYRYHVRTYGHTAALLISKLNARVFRPGCAAIETDDPIPQPLSRPPREVNRANERFVTDAGLLRPA